MSFVQNIQRYSRRILFWRAAEAEISRKVFFFFFNVNDRKRCTNVDLETFWRKLCQTEFDFWWFLFFLKQTKQKKEHILLSEAFRLKMFTLLVVFFIILPFNKLLTVQRFQLVRTTTSVVLYVSFVVLCCLPAFLLNTFPAASHVFMHIVQNHNNHLRM